MPCYRSSTPYVPPKGHPERNLRKYAAREYKENIESFIPRGGLNQANLKLGMKSIHTVDVANRPPPIDAIEIGMVSHHQPLHV